MLLPACLGMGRSECMIQPDSRLCLGHVTTWLIAPGQHRNPPDCRRGSLARFAMLGPQLKSWRVDVHGATHRALAADTPRVLLLSCLIGVLLFQCNLIRLKHF